MSDAVFQSRIDEINREMTELMERNAKRKDELRTESAHQPPPYATSSKYAPLISTSSDVVAREVQTCVMREMRLFEDHVREVVNREWETRAAEMDNLLRSRFVELKSAHDNVGKIVLELASELAATKQLLRDSVQDMKDELQAKVTEITRDQAARERTVKRDLAEMRATLEELGRSTREDSEEFQLRVENSLKRGLEKVGKVAAASDEQMVAARAELIDMVRVASKKSAAEFDELERHLHHLHSSIEEAEKTLKRATVQIADLVEENGTHRSEIRALRSDADRLELLMQQKVDRVPGALLQPLGGGGAQDAAKLYQDIYALKQSVAYLGQVVEDGGAPRGQQQQQQQHQPSTRHDHHHHHGHGHRTATVAAAATTKKHHYDNHTVRKTDARGTTYRDGSERSVASSSNRSNSAGAIHADPQPLRTHRHGGGTAAGYGSIDVVHEDRDDDEAESVKGNDRHGSEELDRIHRAAMGGQSSGGGRGGGVHHRHSDSNINDNRSDGEEGGSYVTSDSEAENSKLARSALD